MLKTILPLLFLCSSIAGNSQSVVKGHIRNYYNRVLSLTISENDSVRYISTDKKGYFLTDLHMLTPFECKISVGNKTANFFSSPGDTATITADYNDFQNSVRINNRKDLVKSSKRISFLQPDGIDSLSDLLPFLKGKLTLIEIWATWCGPCIAQQNMMEKYKAKYRGLGLNFLYISMDNPDKEDRWKRFIYATALEGAHLHANEKLWKDIVTIKKYNAIPVYLIVDKSGTFTRYQSIIQEKDDDIFTYFRKDIAALFTELDKYISHQ
jgi:thiol-disulfide isomerase/thioredoxin